jgi:hypothetical protein
MGGLLLGDAGWAPGGRGHTPNLAKQESKSLLFLKKKKQKDFYPFARGVADTFGAKMCKSFLLLFFKKEALS